MSGQSLALSRTPNLTLIKDLQNYISYDKFGIILVRVYLVNTGLS